jgi:hypothetical protein
LKRRVCREKKDLIPNQAIHGLLDQLIRTLSSGPPKNANKDYRRASTRSGSLKQSSRIKRALMPQLINKSLVASFWTDRYACDRFPARFLVGCSGWGQATYCSGKDCCWDRRVLRAKFDVFPLFVCASRACRADDTLTISKHLNMFLEMKQIKVKSTVVREN